MSATMSVRGKCLCERVEVHAPEANRHFEACHCGMCRRWGGGPALVTPCGETVDFEGAENITTFASSEWAERAFCSRCGTHLYYRLKATGQYMLPLGLFDVGEFDFEKEIFVDAKPDYYSFANETEKLTEQQVLDQFAAPPP